MMYNLIIDSLTSYINSSTSQLSLYYNDDWYPVCSDTITESEVTVICRELGFNEGVTDSVSFDFYSTNSECSPVDYKNIELHKNQELIVLACKIVKIK